MKKVNIVLAPIPDTPNYSFVEIEDEDRHSISIGNWIHYSDDFCAIQIPDPRPIPVLHKALKKIADYPMIFSLMPQIIEELQGIAKAAIEDEE